MGSDQSREAARRYIQYHEEQMGLCLQGAAAVAQYLLAVFAEDPGFTPTIYNRTLQLFVIQVPGIQHPRLVLHAWVVNSLPTEPSF